jgi:ATP citrate (pro-S)-lyase
MDYAWAKQLGLVRKPAEFVSSISDDRGDELLYAGIPISRVFEEDLGIGGVLGLLWFRRRLPAYFTRFIEMVLMVTADHGPAVSGAHNTIVTARAGKDLVSALCSGLLTIGPRFGGALDDAALQFTAASDAGTPAKQFVKDMRAANKLIMGIGHRVKSLKNPDRRVVIIKDFATKHFPDNTVLKFALAVEQETTAKKENLILNVDGAIAVCFVDLLRSCGSFSREEADEALASGCLNGLFVMGRSIGFIGHYLDQVRLKQGLYRYVNITISFSFFFFLQFVLILLLSFPFFFFSLSFFFS